MAATLTEGTSTTSSADLALENVKFPQTAGARHAPLR